MKYRLTAILTLLLLFVLGYFKNTIPENVYLIAFTVTAIICIISWVYGIGESEKDFRHIDPFVHKKEPEKSN